MMDRRRALMMDTEKIPYYGTPFLSPFSEWHKAGGYSVLSDDSIQFKNNSTSTYTYSAGTMGMLYSELIGKNIVIDFDMSISDGAYTQVGTKANNNAGYGISVIRNKVTIANQAGQTHYHAEFVIGTDYTSADTNYYFVVALRPKTANVIISNFKCGYK